MRADTSTDVYRHRVDWNAWHRDYDQDTPLARRLAIVRARIRDVLSELGTSDIRIISMCAGDGRDIVGALEGRPEANRMRGRLVELNPGLAARARSRSIKAGLSLDVVEGDAGSTDAYEGATPADLLLACGVFGNISDGDVAATIRHLPMLVASGGFVIWTRTRRAPDLTPAIRAWFGEAGFAEIAFDAVPDGLATVGVHRLIGPSVPLLRGLRLFEFNRTG